MKFIISSSLLSQTLQAISRVISSKNTQPILDCFLFEIEGSQLKITASDMETTMQSTISIENIDDNGSVAIPAKRIADSIREFSEQPLTIEINKDNWECTIIWSSGKLSIPGISSIGYPEGLSLTENHIKVNISAEQLYNGISNTIFATSTDTMRLVINGIYVNINPNNITFVATDAFRVVRIENPAVTLEEEASFILPQKPAQLLRAIMPKSSDINIELSFDDKNAIFSFPSHRIVCRLIEGKFPNYEAVIPKKNDKKIVVNRMELLSAIKRVSVCSNQVSGLIQFSLTENNLAITAQDIDFATSAEDNISCQYTGEPLDIGFKSSLLRELLDAVHSTEIEVSLADQTKPGLFIPVEEGGSEQPISLLMLLMPMTIK